MICVVIRMLIGQEIVMTGNLHQDMCLHWVELRLAETVRNSHVLPYLRQKQSMYLC